jgi:hypothetical protein
MDPEEEELDPEACLLEAYEAYAISEYGQVLKHLNEYHSWVSAGGPTTEIHRALADVLGSEASWKLAQFCANAE